MAITDSLALGRRTHEECDGCAKQYIEPAFCEGHPPGPSPCRKFHPVGKYKHQPPAVGDRIYVRTACSCDHGWDDVAGGWATVSHVRAGISGGDVTAFVEVNEHEGRGYNWDMLAVEQEALRERFGIDRAHPDPDVPEHSHSMYKELFDKRDSIRKDNELRHNCPKGGHKWGTDGQHSNVFCKLCFVTAPPGVESDEGKEEEMPRGVPRSRYQPPAPKKQTRKFLRYTLKSVIEVPADEPQAITEILERNREHGTCEIEDVDTFEQEVE